MGYQYNYEKPAPVPKAWDVNTIIALVIAILMFICMFVDPDVVAQFVSCVVIVCLIVCLLVGFPIFALKSMFGDL
jgi:hypothetical protein